MEFEREFFYDEVQDGFYVPGIMKRAWAAQLEILSEIDQICKKWGISYFAGYGTLLGAVRHQGFIPWDDDIDIMMLREDYDKFRQAVKELPEDIYFVSIETNRDRCNFTSAVGTDAPILSLKKLEKFHQFPYPVSVDIFPVDELSDNPEKEASRRLSLEALSKLAWAIQKKENKTKEFQLALKAVEERLKISFKRGAGLNGQIYETMNKLFSEFKGQGGKMGVFFPDFLLGKDKPFPLTAVQERKYLPFHKMKLPVPNDYECILRNTFGDYMNKIKGGSDHNYPFFKKCEQGFKQDLKDKWCFSYQFTEKDLEREEVKSLREMVLDNADYLLSATKAIVQRFVDEEMDLCLLELSRIQEEAISFGDWIEQKKGEGTESVFLLTEYCEALYNSYQFIEEEKNLRGGGIKGEESEGAHLEEIVKRPVYLLEKLLPVLKKDFQRQVVFLPHSTKHFSSLSPLIDVLRKDGDIECKIIPIPYYDRLGDGSLSTMHYEGDTFPDEYEILDYHSYDFGGELPDAIVINSPYDECNQVWTVDPFFYSKEMKKYTKKLIYIPWFVTDEIDTKNKLDERAFDNMSYYVTVPGIFHSDLTIVQSEQMKKAYLEKIEGFTSRRIKKIMSKKLAGFGSCLLGEKKENGTEALVKAFRCFL